MLLSKRKKERSAKCKENLAKLWDLNAYGIVSLRRVGSSPSLGRGCAIV